MSAGEDIDLETATGDEDDEFVYSEHTQIVDSD
jgi:hypothetical protein